MGVHSTVELRNKTRASLRLVGEGAKEGTTTREVADKRWRTYGKTKRHGKSKREVGRREKDRLGEERGSEATQGCIPLIEEERGVHLEALFLDHLDLEELARGVIDEVGEQYLRSRHRETRARGQLEDETRVVCSRRGEGVGCLRETKYVHSCTTKRVSCGLAWDTAERN